MDNAKKILIVVIVLAIVAGISAISIAMKKNFNESTSIEIAFAVEYDGAELKSENNMQFVSGNFYTFTCNKQYEFSLLPNTADKNNDFTFTIDGKNKQFFSEINLVSAFDVIVNRYTLSIGAKPGITFKTLIESIYPGQEIIMPAQLEESNAKLFTLQIRERQGKAVFNINFGIDSLNIALPDNVVF